MKGWRLTVALLAFTAIVYSPKAEARSLSETSQLVIAQSKPESRLLLTKITNSPSTSPNDAFIHFVRGSQRYELGDYQGAVADFNQALQIDPHIAEAYGNRGIARYLLEDTQGAIADLQKAAELFQQQGRMADYQYTLKTMQEIRDNQSPFIWTDDVYVFNSTVY